MNRQQLIDSIRRKRSFLCVGLDPDTAKMPAHLDGNLLEFNKQIIDATAEYAIAYKPNLAFYEVLGTRGYEMFECMPAASSSNWAWMPSPWHPTWAKTV